MYSFRGEALSWRRWQDRSGGVPLSGEGGAAAVPLATMYFTLAHALYASEYSLVHHVDNVSYRISSCIIAAL